MNKSSVPELTTEDRAQYRAADMRESEKPPFQTAIESTFVRRSDLEELERRVTTLETDLFAYIESTSPTTETHFPRFEATLKALLEKHDSSPASDNSREYYEQQIEEISAKWQAAEECAKSWQKDYIQVLRERNEAEVKLLTMGTQHSCDTSYMAETISELREKVEASAWKHGDAVANYHKLKEKHEELKVHISNQADTIHALRDQLAAKTDRCEQLEAIIAQKNREISDGLHRSGLKPEFIADAKLGALVRGMPKHYILFRAINAPAGWMVEGMGLQISRDTPEESLEALLKAKEGE